MDGRKDNAAAASDSDDLYDQEQKTPSERRVMVRLGDMIDAIRPIYDKMKWRPFSLTFTYCGLAGSKGLEVSNLEDNAGGGYVRRIIAQDEKARNKVSDKDALFNMLFYLENFVLNKQDKAEQDYRSNSGTEKYTMDNFMALHFINTSPGDHDITRLVLLALKTTYNEFSKILPEYIVEQKYYGNMYGRARNDWRRLLATKLNDEELVVPEKYLKNETYQQAFLGKQPEAKAAAKPAGKRK